MPATSQFIPSRLCPHRIIKTAASLALAGYLLMLGGCGGAGADSAAGAAVPVGSTAGCAAQDLSWAVAADVCTARAATAATGATITLTDGTGPATGSAAFTCSNGAWNAAPNASCSVAAVQAGVHTLEVSPALQNVNPAASLQLGVTLRDAGGGVVTGAVIEWRTSDATRATVSASGVVTAVATGTATITATSEGKTGSTLITVPALVTGAATAGDWLVFSHNVQDFAYPERSAATIDRIVTLHEQYRVPVDIYVTDWVLQSFETQYPALMARLRSSPYVALNYHIRPPKPYYTGYDDWAGLANLAAPEQRG